MPQGMSIEAQKRDADGNVIPEGGRQAEDDADSSGGETDVGLTAQERALQLIAQARRLLRGPAPENLEDADILRGVQRQLLDLLTRREADLGADVAARLRRYVRRLATALAAYDADDTQPPESEFPAGSEAELSEDSDDDMQAFDDSGSQLLSQLADDIESVGEDELEATQLEQMDIDEGVGARAARLRALRDAVVQTLRDAPVDGGVPPELRARAESLIRQLKAYQAVNEAARQMIAALATLLAQAPLAVAAADEPMEPERARIVGRATDVLGNGGRRQSYLLYAPRDRPQYTWLTETGMLADAALASILANYTGPRGDDPAGNGYVTAIVAARGPVGRRQYNVQWTIEPQVPLRFAQEWMLRPQLVPGAQSMADAFERQDDPESDDEAEDDALVQALSQSQLEDDDASARAPGLTLQWDPASGRPRLSLRQAIAVHAAGHDWTIQALKEWTLTRMWALRSRTPPAMGSASGPSMAELDQLGRDLFSVQEVSLVAAFKRERVQAARDAALANDEDDEEEADDEDGDEEALATWRADRERELRDEAVARWQATRQTDAPEMDTLQAQLAALKAIEATGGGDVTNVDVDGLLAADENATARLITAWQTEPVTWPSQLASPKLRLPKIRDFLSSPSRSAVSRGWLKLLRDIHSAANVQQRRSGIFGSAFGPTWPTNPSATETPPDHVVPIRWYESGTKLLIEAGDPGQLPAVCLSRLSENSTKGDGALGLFSDETGSAGQDVYSPKGVSDAKKAMLARMTAWCFALYPLISNQKRSIGIAAYARSTGLPWYARAWQTGSFKQLVRTPATPFERRIALLTLAIPRWQVGNPLTFAPELLERDIEELLRTRFRGDDALPRLVDTALQGAVRAAPR